MPLTCGVVAGRGVSRRLEGDRLDFDRPARARREAKEFVRLDEPDEVAHALRARYRYHLAEPKLAAFYAATPIFNTWDDHEIVDDWGAERMRNNGQAQLLEDGMRAWFEYQPAYGRVIVTQ